MCALNHRAHSPFQNSASAPLLAFGISTPISDTYTPSYFHNAFFKNLTFLCRHLFLSRSGAKTSSVSLAHISHSLDIIPPVSPLPLTFHPLAFLLKYYPLPFLGFWVRPIDGLPIQAASHVSSSRNGIFLLFHLTSISSEA